MKIEVVGFDWDAGNREKCQKHGLSIAELESVFLGGMSVFPDMKHSQGEERFIAIGETTASRKAFVVFTLRTCEDGVLIRPISARYMHAKEIEHYEKTTRT